MKTCNRCKQEKESDEFYISRAAKDGLQGTCKKCQRERQIEEQQTGALAARSRRHYAKDPKKRIAAQVVRARRRKVLLVEELGGKCVRCDYDKSLAALSFHHRDPATKEYEIGTKLTSYGIERLRKEASKCDLLCSNCHMEIEHPIIEEITGEHIA